MEVSPPELLKSCPGGEWVFPVIPRGGMAVWGEAAAGCTLPTPKAISVPSGSPIQHPETQELSREPNPPLLLAPMAALRVPHPATQPVRAAAGFPALLAAQ